MHLRFDNHQPLRGSAVVARELISKLCGSRDWGLVPEEDMTGRGSNTQGALLDGAELG